MHSPVSSPRGAFLFALFAGVAGVLGVAGCSSSAEDGTPPAVSCDVTIDRFKELSIVDEEVMNDPRAKNAADGVFSFRHQVEAMKPASMSSSDFIADWLGSWSREQRVNLFVVPRRPKLETVITCPWLQRTPSNNCNADCSACDKREFDLAQAPFRLIAVANRLDLQQTEQRYGVGEGRLVYALVNGAADDPAAQPLRMTVGLEYHFPPSGGRDLRYWAGRWHSLGKHADFGPAFRDELATLVGDFTARDSMPGAPNGSSLGQVRTNEIELDWLWELREFHLTEEGLRNAPTLNTPDKTVNGTEELGQFVSANRNDVLLDRHRTPLIMTGGTAVPDTRWRIPGVPEDVRRAFAKNTCDGCHQTEETPIDFNFHVSPFRKGVAKLSPFLNNPNGGPDTLSFRAEAMRTALCGK